MKDPSRVRVVEPLARYAPGFCDELARRGWARSTAAHQLELMGCLARWMAAEQVSVGKLTPDVVGRFLEWRRTAGYRHFRSSRGVEPLMTYLRGVGAAPVAVAPPAHDPIELVVERYRAYLLAERGLAAGTLRYYERIARTFLAEISADGGLDVGRLTASEVSGFVLAQSATRSVGTTKNVVMALRSLLRFLHLDGVIAGDLAGAVLAVAPQARSLPRALDPGLVARLLASCDRRTSTGRRDFAVLTVLARLGLRAGEVAAIELSDIDWGAGELLVRGKGGQQERLPLPVDVGTALADYVRRGRRRVDCQRLFLRVIAPTGGLSGDGVTGIVHGACRRCELPLVGAHRLRHTAATETLRAGASLEEIGQLLRQRSEFTTAIYAKVDRAALRQLARSWPGGVA
ncbi:MAG: site-specific integrase [Actinobacteria bacterium]|nr:site-specific integrase [Actinomycetota bacterium]